MTPLANTNKNQFGDTTYTKVFVGGLPWETQKDTMKEYFEQFGDILEAVVISDKSTGRSKGYGFVTFREAESAMKACVDPAPVIDGRRANCNLAAFAAQKSKPSSPNKQGVAVERSTNNNHFQKGGVRVGTGTTFASATNFPHYAHAVQHGIPYNVIGYSQDYAYPTNYYGLYGEGIAGQYPVYGTAVPNVGMTTGFTRAMVNATPYYPFVQYPTGGGYGHYAYQSHQQQQHQVVPYLAMNATVGSYAYQPYAHGPPVSVAPPAFASGLNMMALAAPSPHH